MICEYRTKKHATHYITPFNPNIWFNWTIKIHHKLPSNDIYNSDPFFIPSIYSFIDARNEICKTKRTEEENCINFYFVLRAKFVLEIWINCCLSTLSDRSHSVDHDGEILNSKRNSKFILTSKYSSSPTIRYFSLVFHDFLSPIRWGIYLFR